MIKEEFCPGDMTRYRMFLDTTTDGHVAGVLMESKGQSFVVEFGHGLITEDYISGKLSEEINTNTVTAFVAWLGTRGFEVSFNSSRQGYPRDDAVTGTW